MMKIFLTWVCCWAILSDMSGQVSVFNRAVTNLHDYEGEAFRDQVDSLLLALDMVSDYNLKRDITLQVAEITRQKDELAYVRALAYMAVYSDPAQPAYFSEAFRIAKKNKSKTMMEYVEERRSHFFIERNQYDSAMFYILKLRDMLPASIRDETARNLLHLLADIYYHTGLYGQAKTEYLKLFRYYQNEGIWSFWRPLVIVNNLGQIAQMESDYSEAARWFRLSLKKADSALHTPDRDNQLTFIYIKLAETSLLQGLPDSANYYLQLAETFPTASLSEDVEQEWMFVKSKIALEYEDIKTAKTLAKKLCPDNFKQYYNYRFVPDVYRHLSDIYQQENNNDTALFYLLRYFVATDSLAEKETQIRSMVFLAEREHEISTTNLQHYQQRYRLVLIMVAGLIVVVMVILWLYRKVYRSKMILVKQLMEKKREQDLSAEHTPPNNEWDEEWEKQYRLVVKLQVLMKSERPYLNPKLNLQQMAELLDTNRTYLSRAINTVLETNFSGFINAYRVSEAARLITEGFVVTHTMEALAISSGFANRAVFNAVFKKTTGVTPTFFSTHYRKEELKI